MIIRNKLAKRLLPSLLAVALAVPWISLSTGAEESGGTGESVVTENSGTGTDVSVSTQDVAESGTAVTESGTAVTESDTDVTESDTAVTESGTAVTESDTDVTEVDADVTEGRPDFAKYKVSLFLPDVTFSNAEESICYPAVANTADINMTLISADGKQYKGLTAFTGSMELYFYFPEMKEIPSKGTLKLSTDISKTVTTLSDVGAYQYLFKVGSEYTNEYPFKASDWKNDYEYIEKGSPAWSTLTDKQKENPIDENGVLVETGDKTLAVTGVLSEYGLCSVQLVDLPDGIDASAPDMFFKRAEYMPHVVTDVTVKIGDTVVCQTQPIGGTIYFTVPVKRLDDDSISKVANVTFEILGFDMQSNGGYTGTCTMSIPKNGVSANTCYLDIRKDFALSFFNDVLATDDEESSSGTHTEIIDGEVVIVGDDVVIQGDDTQPSLFTSSFKFNIESTLSKYNLDFAGFSKDGFVKGAATQNYVNTLGGDLGEQVSWGTINLGKSGTATVSVEEGKYSIETSDALDVQYKGSLEIKSGKTNEVTVKVAPKYTLKVKASEGTIDGIIGGKEYKGDLELNFAIEKNVLYELTDKLTGRLYQAIATDENPNVEIVLGSATDSHLIGATTGTDGGAGTPQEGVPNTSDPVTLILIIMACLLATFVASFFFVYRANKRAEGR